MSRRWVMPLIFGVCVLALLGAMAWVTLRALALERAEAVSRARAAHQESVRLALWRMDSALSAVIARESARPFFHYRAFYPASRPYDEAADVSEPLAPSPLLGISTERAEADSANAAESIEPARLYFEIDAQGQLTSPQAPAGSLRMLALDAAVDWNVMDAADKRLAQLRAMLPATALALEDRSEPVSDARRDAEMTRASGETTEPPGAPAPVVDAAPSPQVAQQFAPAQDLMQNEWVARKRSAEAFQNIGQSLSKQNRRGSPQTESTGQVANAVQPASDPLPAVEAGRGSDVAGQPAPERSAAIELYSPALIESHRRGGARVLLPLTERNLRLQRNVAPKQPKYSA